MKVGILTFHIADNYGAVLQCFALQKFLENLGHEVKVLDYQQSFLKRIYRKSDLRMFFANLLIGHRFEPIKLIKRNKTIRKFNDFRAKYLNIDIQTFNKVEKIPNDLGLYVIGSDQLWNYKVCGDIYDPLYWGSFKKLVSGKVASYAVSTSVESLQEMPKELLTEYLSNFDAISVREDKLIPTIKKFTDKKTVSNVDPTLLLSSCEWDNVVDSSNIELPREYILVYTVRNYFGNCSSILQKAKSLSDKLGIPVIEINTKKNYSPEDFLKLIKNANYVMTSSFHASVFSVIFKRNLTAYIYNDPSDERYVNLLKMLHLEDCLAPMTYTPTSIPSIDYSNVEEYLRKFKTDSKAYFEDLCLID